MKTLSSLLLTLGIATSMVSCSSDKASLVGNWTSSAPEVVTESIYDASSALRTTTIDFQAPEGNAAGIVTLTSVYDVTKAVADSTGSSYQVTATIQGTYSLEANEDDDYLISFDKNSLAVNGVDAPELGVVTDNFLSSLQAYTKIEDVKVSKDGKNLTFEAGKPEVNYYFVKTE